MEEILFRGKSRKGIWYEGFLTFQKDGFWIREVADMPPTYLDPGGSQRIDDYEIMLRTIGQFIGIKDKKGVKIFEGDRVQFIHDDKIIKRDVKFNDKIMGFDPFCTPIDYDEIYLRKGTLEIIGNIHGK